MKTIVPALVAVSVLAGFWLAPAKAHGWYPKECCHDHDCAPVESMVQFVPTGGGPPELIVSSKLGVAIVPQNFPMRESKDGRMHVCMQADIFELMRVICLFMPPSM